MYNIKRGEGLTMGRRGPGRADGAQAGTAHARMQVLSRILRPRLRLEGGCDLVSETKGDPKGAHSRL